MMYPTPGPQSSSAVSQQSQEMEAPVSVSKQLPAARPVGSDSRRDRIAPAALRVLDWTGLESAPSAMDVMRMANIGGRDGIARLAVVVNTPRMLRSANVFAEQAGLHGAQVRVFHDAKEATAWLYKDVPSALLDHQWPRSHSTSVVTRLAKDGLTGKSVSR